MDLLGFAFLEWQSLAGQLSKSIACAACSLKPEYCMQAAEAAVMRLSLDASLLAVERVVEEGLARECRAYNQRKPLITVIAHELNSKAGAAAYANAVKSASAQMEQPQPGMGAGRQTRSRGNSSAGRGRGRPSAGVSTAEHPLEF